MHFRLRPRLGFALLARILVVALLYDLAEAAEKDHSIIFKRGQTTACVEGHFSRRVHEVYFSFHARDGQHLRVKIMPLSPDLITAGVVIYPSGKQDGGPGGTVFDSGLTETGTYRVRVTRRQIPTAGKFRVLVEISP